MINFFNKKNRGESLTEVLVAVGILVVVLVASLLLVNRGSSTNVTVKNKIIAINIAREGVEAVRNIRDTNWLKFSGDRRNKWLCLDSVDTTMPLPDTIIDCTNERIADEMYTVEFNNDLDRFFATEEAVTDALDLSNTGIDFSSYQLYKGETSLRYTHEPVNRSTTTNNAETIFYRQLELTPEQEPNCGSAICDNLTRLHVVSRVQWEENLLVGTVTIETYLYDYLDREEYN